MGQWPWFKNVQSRRTTIGGCRIWINSLDTPYLTWGREIRKWEHGRKWEQGLRRMWKGEHDWCIGGWCVKVGPNERGRLKSKDNLFLKSEIRISLRCWASSGWTERSAHSEQKIEPPESDSEASAKLRKSHEGILWKTWFWSNSCSSTTRNCVETSFQKI